MQCQQCGSCCRHLTIEIPIEEIEGTSIEKRVKRKCVPLIGCSDEVESYGFNFKGNPHCVFLRGNLCSIYRNRPETCRTFTPGGKQCRLARKSST